MDSTPRGTLILPSFLMDETGKTPKENWGVRVVDDQIAVVAPNADLRRTYPNYETWDASGQTPHPLRLPREHGIWAF